MAKIKGFIKYMQKRIGLARCWIDDAHPNKYYTDAVGDLRCARCHRELT